MDLKLAKYRAIKRRERLFQSSKEKIYSLFSNAEAMNSMTEKHSSEEGAELKIEDDKISISSDGENSLIDEDNTCDELTYSKIYLYVSLWLILFSLAIYLEVGAIYFLISGFYIIWANTRTGPKRRGEISAYSVFNPNCEAIDGTLKPEQFENELRYGALR